MVEKGNERSSAPAVRLPGAERIPAGGGNRSRTAALLKDEARLLPGVLTLCRRLGQGGADIRRFPGGSLPVYAVGDRLVLKLYPPIRREHWQVEDRVLRTIDDRLPVPTPRIEEAGEFGEWRYVLMTRLFGEPLTAVWPRTGERDRDRLVAVEGRVPASLANEAAKTVGREGWTLTGFVS